MHAKAKKGKAREARTVAPEAPSAELPYTVHFPDGRGWREADLEHPAPLPRVGDTVEYLDESGARRRYVVSEVVHTLQTTTAGRPRVRDGEASPDALAHPGGPAETPGEGGALRAGLPKVFLRATPARGRSTGKRAGR